MLRVALDNPSRSPSPIPFLDLQAQNLQIRREVERKIAGIISSSAFILGEHVDRFERDFARTHDVAHCLGLSSGTAALHTALHALGIGAGDRVVVPVNTFIATAEAASVVGAEPVFVDCDEYGTIDVGRVEALLAGDAGGNGRGRIKAVIAVHLYGQPARMSDLCAVTANHGVHLIEDAAQAHLAEWERRKVGGFGAVAAFSFYPGKNLGAFGEAGALLTNDTVLYERARLFRQHGEVERYRHVTVGHNYRMEAIQGAVLETKLQYLPEWTKQRCARARVYDDGLAGIDGVETPSCRSEAGSVYHLYVIRARDRDGLRRHLAKQGIETGLHYPVPLHLQPAYAGLGYARGDFPVAERAAQRVLSLPLYPELSDSQIERVCESIREYYAEHST